MKIPMSHALSAVATAALVYAVTVPVQAWAQGDQAFLRKAMQGDNSEVALGRIAQQKGASSGIRDFGRMLAEDHAKAKVEVVPVAKAHGVAATEAMAPEARAERRKLQGLSGSAFDREFARYMVEDHKKDIADFEKQAKQGDAATKALAEKTLPVLHKHLETAEKLAS